MNDTRSALLEALAEGPVSGPEVAERLDVSRAAVWKHVEALREAGFEIEGGDEGGYELVTAPEYGGPAIEYGLEAPFDVEFYESLPSTNDRARELAAEGAEDVAVVAGEQTGGRGRLDREWASPPGGVWLSLVLRPDMPPAHVPLLTLAASVAVTRTAREVGVDAGIKWPNDVLVTGGNEVVREAEGEERKLAGILTEMEGEADRVEWVVVGIGVNVNLDAEDLPEGATSVREHVGDARESGDDSRANQNAPRSGDVERRTFVQRLLEEFDVLRADPDAVLDAWNEHSLTLDRVVRVETPGGVVVGEALRVEHPGTLVVATDGGERRVHAGDCEHLRPVE